MKYILFNISVLGGNMVETEMDKILKETPFAIKDGIKGQRMDYSYILIPVENADLEDEEFLVNQGFQQKITGVFSNDELYSLFKLLKPIIYKNFVFTIDIINNKLTSDSFNILYTDGSFKKATGKSSYACCQLIESVEGRDQLTDCFSGKTFSYNAFNGIIDDSTNNIGELTGIKVASEHFGERQYQIIISDSEYSIKSFREWYYTWERNDFKNYAKKPIKNEQLIKDTFKSLHDKNKIVLFKWTHGHNDDVFNEKCDELAKSVLGIEK